MKDYHRDDIAVQSFISQAVIAITRPARLSTSARSGEVLFTSPKSHSRVIASSMDVSNVVLALDIVIGWRQFVDSLLVEVK